MVRRSMLGMVLGSVMLMGAGCVEVRVLDRDRPSVTDVNDSGYSANERVSIARRTVKENVHVTVIRLLKGRVRLALERPRRDDASLFLSVAGTYTSPADAPEGFVVHEGTIVQARERQAWNGAAFFRADGTLSIFETNNGKLLTKAYLQSVERDGASLIQGHLLVADRVAQDMAPQTPYQRRALVVMPDESVAIVESVELLDLQSFADALVELGVRDALNLDMGQWSEGWYRSPVTDEPVMIGYLTGSTHRQSNWVIFQDR